MAKEYTDEPENATHIETWDPYTQRYSGRTFNPNSSFDRELLRRAQTDADKRGQCRVHLSRQAETDEKPRRHWTE